MPKLESNKTNTTENSKNFFSLDLIYIFCCLCYKLTLIVLFFYAGQAKNLCLMLDFFIKELKTKEKTIFRCISFQIVFKVN